MDFPIFYFPYIGNRMLIAVIGIVHVLISHGCAIGGSLMFVMMEYKAIIEKNDLWLDTAKKMTRLILIITTSLGALTGVGIWFTTAVVSPYGIGSLLRVFFWVWFFEWIVFVTELILILVYYLSWKYMSQKAHFCAGVAYVIVSYITMAIIVGVLGAMLTPGAWVNTKSFFDGFFNASYIPQLLARMFMAPLLGCGFVLFFFRFFKFDENFRHQFNAFFGKALILFSILFTLTAINYYQSLPEYALKIAPIALTTKAFTQYAKLSLYIIPAIGIILAVIGIILQTRFKLNKILVVIPILFLAITVSQFERVREFVRKPFIIYNYLYTNGITLEEADLFNEKGILSSINWTGPKKISQMTGAEKGNIIFKVECANCHTYKGINSIFNKTKSWNENTIFNFLGTYKKSHPYMPPFTGTDEERKYLTQFLITRGEQ